MPTPRKSRSTVLVVDDEDLVLMAITASLEKLGLKAITALSGREGIDCFIRHRDEIALVIVDIVMPGMLGTEMAKEILKIDPHAKILLMSGYPMAEPEHNARLAFPFINKPVLTGDLLFKIESIIGPVTAIAESTQTAT